MADTFNASRILGNIIAGSVVLKTGPIRSLMGRFVGRDFVEVEDKR